MTIENPPKLWCFTLPTEMAGDITLLAETETEAVHLRKQEPEPHRCSPVQAYVREDVADAAARYKNRDVEVMRVALADLRRIRGCLATRANTLRTIGEEDRAKGLEDAIKQLDEEVFT